MVNPKICSNCSAPLPNNVRFCTKCGTKIEGNTDSAPHQTERASKIEEFPITNASYQKPQNDPLNDSIESLRESGQDFQSLLHDQTNVHRLGIDHCLFHYQTSSGTYFSEFLHRRRSHFHFMAASN